MKSLFLILFTVLLFGTTKASNNLEISYEAISMYIPTINLNIDENNILEKPSLNNMVTNGKIIVEATFTDACGRRWKATTTCSCQNVAQAQQIQAEYIHDHMDDSGCIR